MAVKKLKPGQSLRISPSQLRFYELCPGYRPDDATSAYAEEGSLLHEAVETRDLSKLDPEQRRAAEFCIANIDSAIMALSEGRMVVEVSTVGGAGELSRQLYALPKGGDVTKVFHCRELFLATVGEIFGGTLDDVLVVGDKAYITDHKFGRGVVDPPGFNRQLKHYSLLFLIHFPMINEVTVRLLCPRQESEACDGDDTEGIVAFTYTRADLPALFKLVYGIMSAARMNRKKLTPNDKSCIYCGRKSSCYAVGRLAMSAVQGYTELSPPEGFDPKGMLRPQDRAYLQAVTKVLEEWGKAVRKSNLDAVLYDNVEIPGYALRRRAGTPRFTSPLLAHRAAVSAGVTTEDFIMACSASVGSVTGAVAASAKARGGDADEAVTAFNNVCETEKIVTRDADVFYLTKVNTPKSKQQEPEVFKQLTEPKN